MSAIALITPIDAFKFREVLSKNAEAAREFIFQRSINNIMLTDMKDGARLTDKEACAKALKIFDDENPALALFH